MTTQSKDSSDFTSPQFTYKAALSHICVDCGQGIQPGDEIVWKYIGKDKFNVEDYRPIHSGCLPNVTV